MHVIWLILIGAFLVMLLGFVGQFIKAWIMKIRYYIEKRKVIKNNDPDSWVYKI